MDDQKCSCKPESYPGFWITEGCPLHGDEEPIEPSEEESGPIHPRDGSESYGGGRY